MSFPLQEGSRGPAVAILQQYLNFRRPAQDLLEVDGIFGPKTKQALFQSPWKITRVPEPIYDKMRAVVRLNRLASLDRQIQEEALEVSQLLVQAKEKGADTLELEAQLRLITLAWSERQKKLASYKTQGRITFQPTLSPKAKALWDWFRVRYGLGISGWLDELYTKAAAGIILGPTAALIPSSWYTTATQEAETALANLQSLKASARSAFGNLALASQGLGKTIMWGTILFFGFQISQFIPKPSSK